MTIKPLKLSGSPYEIGYQHGQAFKAQIREYTAERIELCSSPKWSGVADMAHETVLALAESSLAAHTAYAPDLMAELQGMADSTELTVAELIVTNGFTDFVDYVYTANQSQTQTASVDDCTAFLVPNQATTEGQAFFGQTWDMHASAEPYVLMLDVEPADGIPFLCFTTMGCIGQIGINAEGIVVGINNIMGEGQAGVIWNFVVRKALAQSTLEDALDCILAAQLMGAHNYMLMDKHGDGYNIEAMATRYHVEKLENAPIIHTNHCVIEANNRVERERHPLSLESSEQRLKTASHLLMQELVDVNDLMALTREESTICLRDSEPLHVASLGATVMRPATREFWAVLGSPQDNDYERFVL